MRKKAAITSGIAAAVLGGGLALALNGGGSASAAGTPAAQARPASATSPTTSPATATISRSEAEQIALTAVSGGQVRVAELEDEHGVPVWSVHVLKSGVTHDVDVDARTGKVVHNRVDQPGKDTRTPFRDDRAHEAEHRHGEPEPGDDRGRETAHRHGGDDAVEGGHRHGGGDDGGHRGRG
jgi:hypothetical protein